MSGALAIEMCYVADGKVDLSWEYAIQDWDIAAGGRVRTVGGSASYLGVNNILATNGRVHQEFLDHAARVARH